MPSIDPHGADEAPSASTAHFLLEGLVEIGVEHVFANLGTDHVSLIEAIAQWDAEGRPRPRMILCPHENVAVHMASGYAALTGRGQVVLVHVDAGTANAAMGLHNVFRRRQPLMLLAGRAPYTLHGELPGSRDHFVHYMQDPFDIAGLVRPFTKWEHTLSSGVNVKEVLRRAHTVAHSAPCAPVFLALPRETLAQPWPASAVRSYPADDYGAVGAGGADPQAARRIAERLRAAERPLAITSYLGRSAEAVRQLEALALEAGLQVVEYTPSDLSLRHDSPCHAGFDPRPAIDDADLVLLLDVDVPWLRQDGPRGELAAEVIHVDVDPLKQDFPMWGFPSRLRVRGDCAIVLAQVREALAALRAADGARAEAEASRVAARIASWQPGREARRARREAAAAARGASGALGADFVCAMLAAALEPRDVVVNEAVRNGRAVLQQSGRTLPGTYIGATGGGLGFSGGMALGARLACPDRRVVRIVGDGSYQFGNPSAEYEVAQQYGLPFLTVILDNGGWAAVKNATRMVHPDGAAQARDAFLARLDGPVRRLEAVAEAFGAYGEAVTEPEALGAAIGRAFAALDDGRAAVLRVSIGTL